MKLTCPACDAGAEVPDEHLPPPGTRTKCQGCGVTSVLTGVGLVEDEPDFEALARARDEEEGAAPWPTAAVDPRDVTWRLRSGGRESGRMSFPELKALIRNGTLKPDDEVVHDESPLWTRAGDTPELVTFLALAAPKRVPEVEAIAAAPPGPARSPFVASLLGGGWIGILGSTGLLYHASRSSMVVALPLVLVVIAWAGVVVRAAYCGMRGPAALFAAGAPGLTRSITKVLALSLLLFAAPFAEVAWHVAPGLAREGWMGEPAAERSMVGAGLERTREHRREAESGVEDTLPDPAAAGVAAVALTEDVPWTRAAGVAAVLFLAAVALGTVMLTAATTSGSVLGALSPRLAWHVLRSCSGALLGIVFVIAAAVVLALLLLFVPYAGAPAGAFVLAWFGLSAAHATGAAARIADTA